MSEDFKLVDAFYLGVAVWSRLTDGALSDGFRLGDKEQIRGVLQEVADSDLTLLNSPNYSSLREHVQDARELADLTQAIQAITNALVVRTKDMAEAILREIRTSDAARRDMAEAVLREIGTSDTTRKEILGDLEK